MLKTVTIHGFKSIEGQTIELGPLNILIGANGSGKSNLLQALRFFQLATLDDLGLLVKKAGGADRLLYHGKKITKSCFLACETNEFRYEQTFIPVASDSLAVAGGKITGKNAENQSIALPSAVAHIRGWRLYHLHDTSDTAAVKSDCNINDNRYLREDASNLAAFLYWLKQSHPVPYRHIVSAIRLAAPFFDDFILEPSRHNERMIRLEWKHKHSDAYFDADSLSDGTLRFMALTTLLNQPPDALPTLIVIDEPELGLHPLAIRLLAEMLDVTSQDAQILVATQSVTLVDYFTLEQIIVVDHDERGSRFRHLREEDYRQWLDDFSTGELWEKNVLGGRP